MKNQKSKSVKKELFNSNIFFTILIVIIMTVILSILLYDLGVSRAYTVLEQRNLLLNTMIDGYFREIGNTVYVPANDEGVKNASSSDAARVPRVLDMYKAISTANRNISYIYSGYETGFLLINDYIPPEGFDPVVRPWYTSAVASMPDISIGTPYQEIRDREADFNRDVSVG